MQETPWYLAHPQKTSLGLVNPFLYPTLHPKTSDSFLSPGSSDAPATILTEECEYDSCPVGSPAEGNNASTTRFNYVNSYPVTSMRYGIQTLSPKFFDGLPDIAVAGFNVGGETQTPNQLAHNDKKPQQTSVPPSSSLAPWALLPKRPKKASRVSPSVGQRALR